MLLGITALAAHVCAAEAGMIHLIGDQQQPIRADVALSSVQIEDLLKLCGEAVRLRTLIQVPDAALELPAADPASRAVEPEFHFFAGTPLIGASGRALGVLGVLDRTPRRLRANQQEMLGVLGRQVALQLDLALRVQNLERIALGHDSTLSDVRLAAIVQSSEDAIVGKDLNGIVTSWNPSAERLFGYAAAEMIGTPILRLIPSDRHAEETRILETIRRGERVEQFDTLRQTRDGRIIDVSVSASPINDRDGRIIGVSKIAHDLTALREREREAVRMSRLYAALSQVNQAIVWTRSRDDLLARICRVLVDFGGFALAWIGTYAAATRTIIPAAAWGEDDGFVRFLSAVVDGPGGLGPTAKAFRSGRHEVCNNLLEVPDALPQRQELEQRGLRAAAAFPIRQDSQVVGVLTVFTKFSDVFGDKEIALLEEAALDVSFALDNLAREEQRVVAERAMQRERRFADAMFESMPGILYFYDDEGRFLRWNREFQNVSGYSAEQIARMHPRDFFAGSDRDLLERKVADVFATGESSMEARFVAQDGTATPYFFTGKRIELDGTPCLVGMGIDISERTAAEAARRISEDRYRALFECAPDGIVVADPDSVYLDANDSICRMLGYRRNELIGLHASDIVAQSETRYIEPALNVIKSSSEYHREWLFRRKDGSLFAAEVIATSMPDGNLLGMIRDITERRRAEEELRFSEDRFRAIFEHAGIGIALVDVADGRIVRCNRALSDMLGYSAAELYCMTMDATKDPSDLVGQRAQTALLLAGGVDRFRKEQRYLRKDGAGLWALLTSTLVHDAAGKPQFLINMIEDITERKRAEMALSELNDSLELKVAARTRELQVALVRAESADTLKSAFLATMSHELRTPLNSIIGFTGLVLKGMAGPLNAEQTKQLGMVRDSARHLLELINDVLDLSKIEAGQLGVLHEPFDPRAAIEQAMTLVKPLADKKGIALAAIVAPEVASIVSDRRRVEQVLINLLNNAVKFTRDGSVTLTAATVEAPAADGTQRRSLRIAVADTGIGIKPEDLPMLFRPFRQIDAGLSRQNEGTGLGLAISRRLVQLLDGNMDVASEWSRGSTFTITLPLENLPS